MRVVYLFQILDTDKDPRCARYEFGGPVGVMAMMTIFPVLMYYLWICLEFYDGQIVYPTSLDDVQPFLLRMFGHAREVGIVPVN